MAKNNKITKTEDVIETPEVEVAQETILTPTEASKQHLELFEESQAKFRNLHNGMNSAIAATQTKNKELDEKIKEAETLKTSAKKLEELIENKLEEANILLEQAKTKMSEAKDEEVRLNGIRVDLEKTDSALSGQREELKDREKAVIESEKSSQMKERELQFIRIKIERLIKDSNIKAELKKEMLESLPKE